jgi:hypothetical protein
MSQVTVAARPFTSIQYGGSDYDCGDRDHRIGAAADVHDHEHTSYYSAPQHLHGTLALKTQHRRALHRLIGVISHMMINASSGNHHLQSYGLRKLRLLHSTYTQN